MQGFLGGLQFAFEASGAARLSLAVRAALPLAHCYGRWLRKESDQQQTAQALWFVDFRNADVDVGELIIDLYSYVFTDRPCLFSDGLVQCGSEVVLQPLASHFQNVQSRLAGGGLEICAGAAVDIDHVAFLIDDHAGGSETRQEKPAHGAGDVRLLRRPR